MKTVILLLSLLIVVATAKAQTEKEKEYVQRAMLDYVEGFYEGDTNKINRSISPEVVKYGYWKDEKSGVYGGEPMSFREMIAYAARVKQTNRQQPATAVRKVEVYDIQDQTASGKITAWWGTDYLLLAKVNNQWMIRAVLWQGPLKR
ncbi:MAG: nuclear transport factor 2 family protein [Chitinophagaceae bacterium]|nr:nuclear transport factor 2 family protein [Chitinophagaceae bacterium]